MPSLKWRRRWPAAAGRRSRTCWPRVSALSRRSPGNSARAWRTTPITCARWPGTAWAGLVTTRRAGTRIFYRLASERVAELWAAMRDVAAEQVAGLDKLARAYLGERDGIEVVGREELVARLERGEVVLLDVRP